MNEIIVTQQISTITTDVGDVITVNNPLVTITGEAEQGPQGPTGPMGSGVAWRGEYDPTASYLLYDAVFYLGSSYACDVPCTGVLPTETSNWEIVVSKGDAGADSTVVGPKGDIGVMGPKGDTGNAGADSTVSGPQGETGGTGPQGIQGIQGTAGVDGVDGDPFIYTDFTEGQLAGLVGPQGEQGIQGIQGITGAAGSNGTNGTDGADSTVAGPQGEQGIQGEPGAAGTTDYTALSNKPTLGTAAAKNIPATGNASATEVVYGSDTRLADARTPSAHTHLLTAGATDVTATAAELNQLDGVTLSGNNSGDQTIASLGLDADLTTLSLPANTTISAAGAELVNDADAAAQRVTLGAAPLTGAWTSFTPAIIAGSGTFTAVSCQGYWTQVGKTVTLSFSLVITTNGTAAEYILMALPVSGKRDPCGSALGREISSTNKIVTGTVFASAGAIVFFNYDGTYPGGDGLTIAGVSTYEAA